MYRKIILTLLVATISLNMMSQDWKVYPYTPTTTPTSEIAFPADEGRHAGEPVEWWYVSGHITTATNKEYSFMLTYFYYPTSVSIFNFDGFRILNLTDESDGTFYQDTKAVNYTTLSASGLDIAANLFPSGSEYWRNKEDTGNMPIPFEYELNASSTDVSISFDLETTKRPLIVGGDGLFDQGLANYTYYYSQTANTVSGSLTVNGTTETVTGSAWIDRQYGNFNPFTGEDYEWFSIKLDNGMDFNLWNIFTADREVPDNAKYKILSAYVDENQNTQYTISDFEIERLEYFFTPDNLRSYSKKWRLTSASKNIDLVITSNYETSEVNITELSFLFYEGATTVAGTVDGNAVTGIGFAELLHNYEHPVISFDSPSGGAYITSSPISWTVDNPDDGRPLQYDLEYSIDNQVTFLPITTGLTTTSYNWDGTGLTNGDNVWFKIKAYSADNTLNSETISSSASSATLSASEVEKNVLSFYPNPVQDQLHLNFKNIPVKGNIQIISLVGQSIVNRPTSNQLVESIDTSFLKNGVYFLKFNSENAEQTIRFIKN